MPSIALVLGGAESLFRDIKVLRELIDVEACTIVAVNDALFRWPGRVDHFATLHPEELVWRAECRKRFGYPDGYQTWTRPYPRGLEARERLCDHVLGGWSDGSSGFFGVGVARAGLRSRRIVAAGCPMDGSPHLDRPCGWRGFPSYRQAWLDRKRDLAPFLRSMSGWTLELYGAPDEKWLDAKVAMPQ